jgi:hypothetical protein
MLRKIASQVAEVMRQDPALSNVNFDWRELSKAIEIEIDQDKARLLGSFQSGSRGAAQYVAEWLHDHQLPRRRENH